LPRGERWQPAMLVAVPMAGLAVLGLYLPPPIVHALQQVAIVLGGPV
jgi:hypothetical protein